MNLEKVVFSFVVLLAATLNFGFFIGELGDPAMHSPWELYAAVIVNVIALVLKFGDRTLMGATHLATSLVAVLQLFTATCLLVYFQNTQPDELTPRAISMVVSLSGGALLANVVSLVLLVVETISFQRR
ncbi:DUF6394 family protein [Mobilicoccus pelagius]|uniref:Uncharacterized protein n=1 Tax=Mobilicoccus pelagius NBRC 104925 TaxID=1089455 RepID=H5UR38_9MICO|nr:DUF6394 family protein [Mobilicoccus pelagius]GAB48196.1 hypothetical protein MOPEL_067_00450 [Mobilicoccus pelagius NBRC 104925]